MTAASPTRQTLVALALLSLAAVPTTLHAQVPGENVNMVTGTQWPGGDPFLQRQNEPSLAVSSENPQHLLAGANDYRSVDVPYPFGPNDPMKMPGDAWLGVFKSMNGGQTWQSVLMPGFPQDTSTLPSQGANSPLRNCVKGSTAPADRCTSAADPVVRAGTDGMLYYSGIAFKRGTSWGKVFLSRFVDLNNKENGDATRTDPGDVTKATPTDPIRFVDQVVIASSDGKVFLDKPWIAVDKPRLLAQMCRVSVQNPDGTTTTKAFPGGAIYASWVRFAPGEVTSDVMFSSSRDCGKTWTAAIKLNDATSSLNQAPTIAIDPFTGFVYVAWRRLQYPATNPTQRDAIMVARSFRGFLFTKPRVVAEFTPFEQASTPKMFRTHAFPSIAISVDPTGYNGWVHIAWPQRMGPHGDSRVVTSTAPVLPPPLNGLEASDPCNGWAAPMPVDDHPITEGYGEGTASGFRSFTRGHQFMPTLTFSQGKLVVLYYDSRLTHTASVFQPNDPFAPDPITGGFYRTERVPITPWDPRNSSGSPEDPAHLFLAQNDEIDDARMTNVRHTVEVRVGTSLAGKDPVFSSVQVTKYRFGERGDEPPGFNVPKFLGPDASAISDRAGGLPITSADSFVRLQQFDVNAPNLPMFKNGTVPFLGDYIDIQGPAFVRKAGGWAFNSGPTAAPVFHAVWATNQDVRPPADGDWTRYTPMKLPGQAGAIFDGAGSTTALAYCTPGAPANEGTRNQNIYTARITEGLLVDSPQNAKPLSSTQTRSFVVAAHNDTSYPKAFRFAFTGVAPSSCVAATGQAGPTSCASFAPDASVPAVDVEILPHSSVTRSLFVRSTSPSTTITVNVNEIVRPDPAAATPRCSLAALDCAYVAGGLSGFVTLNPPGSSPFLIAPDGSTTGAGTNETLTFANVSTANVSTANVSTANVSTANVSTANISTANVSTANVCTANVSTANVSTANVCTANVSTANVSTANVSTANVSTANVTTANISTANVSTANVSTANVSTANVSTANVSTANVSTANVSTANVSTAPVSDLNYEVTNTSNTTTSYSVQFVCADPAGCPASTPLHLMVNKFYAIPASVGCRLVAEPRPVLVANGGYVQEAFVSPDSLIDPKTREGQASNATLSLAPGEKAQITLRGRVTLAEMAAIGTKLAPALIPHGTPRGGSVGGTQTYASSSTFGLPSTPTQTTLTASGNTYTATVVGVPATAVPTGKVTFIAGGATLVGVGPLDVTGKATLTASLPVGTALVAYYGGDSKFKASSGAFGQKLATSLGILVDANPPSVPGRPVTVGFVLTAPAGSPPPSGAVQLYDGDLRAAAPSAFTCGSYQGAQRCTGSWSVTPAPGNHSFWAEYVGDAGYAGSTSNSLPWAVSSATVTVTPPASAPIIGQAVTFAASVANAGSQAVTWTVDPSTTASIDGTGSFVATAAGTYAVTATSAVDPAATGSATVVVAQPTLALSPGGAGSVSLLTGTAQVFTATVGGILNPVVTWSYAPTTVGVSITPLTATTATFLAAAAGTYSVTATAGGVSRTATVVVTAPVLPSPFGIGGAVNDGFVHVAVNQDFAAYSDATVTVTAGGIPVNVPRVGNGLYETSAFTLPPAGQPVTLTVSGGGLTATATGIVPERPVVTAPARDSVQIAANPIAVSWTTTTSPDDFALDGWCGNGQCVAGIWATVPGTERGITLAGGFFPAGQTVQMGVYAQNRMTFSGDALAASSLVVNARAPSASTYWNFLVTETTTGGLLRARSNHVSLLLDGSIYSVGGRSTSAAAISSVERHDTTTGTSTLVAPMLEARSAHGAIAMGGKIYAFGGVTATGQFSASAEVYDPAANTWTPLPAMPVARTAFRAAQVGSRIFTVGGFSEAGASDRVDAYDPATRTWSFVGYLAASRSTFALGEAQGKLYAIGGMASVAGGAPALSVEVLDGSAPGTLIADANVTQPKGLSAASANGLVFVTGNSDPVMAVFDPATGVLGPPPGSWTVPGPGAPLYANPVGYASSVTDGTRLWVVGGEEPRTATPLATVTQVPLPVFVAVTPGTVTLNNSQTVAFSASVRGASNPAVTWSASGGTISPSGIFTPPYAGGTFTITATSVAAPTSSGTATVTVLPPTVVGLTVSPNPTPFEGTVTATLQFAAPLSGPPATGTVTFADQLHTSTAGATAFAPVTVPVACRAQPQALGLPLRCTATATLPAWTLSGLHTVMGAYGGDANFSRGIATIDVDVEIPVPVLEFTGATPRSTGGKDYNLRIANWNQYPVEAFASQGVQSCGSNRNAARTWVDILDGVTGTYVYGFCAFASPSNLQDLWFFVPQGGSPPASVKVRATDWIRNVVVESNVVTLPAPVTVVVDPPSANLQTGDLMGFVAIVGGTANTGVTWSVAPATGATVSTAGVFQASAAGTYVVTATSVVDPSASGSATVTVEPAIGLFVNATAAIQGVAPATPYRSFNVTLQDAARQPIPSGELRVTLTSSANPTSVMNVPAYPAGGPGYFSASGLSFASGDTVTMEVTRIDPTSAQVVARTKASVAIPGMASLTAATASAGTASVAWSHTGPEPQQFWFWWTGQGSVPSAGGGQRATSFPVSATPPFGMQITATNSSSAFSDNGSGVFTSRTDDNLSFTVAAPAPVVVTFTSTIVDPSEAGLGYSVKLTGKVGHDGASAARPDGVVAFQDFDTGVIIGKASLTRDCDTGFREMCADLIVQTDAPGLGIALPADASQWHGIVAIYEGSSSFQASSDELTADLYVYRTGQWLGLSGLGVQYTGAAAVGRMIYTFDDAGVAWRYDPTMDRWTSYGTLPHGSSRVVAAAPNGKIYVLARYWPFVEVDPAAGTITQLPAGPTGTERIHAAAAALPDGRVLVIGGFSSDGPVGSSVVAFDTITQAQSSLAPMPTPRAGASAAHHSGKVYVVGGEDDAGNPLSTVEIYDVATDSWSTGPSLLRARSFPAVTISSGKAYVIGGTGSPGEDTGVEILDLASPGTWSPGPAVLAPRTGAAAATLAWDGGIYLVGGWKVAGGSNVPTEVLFP